MKLDSEFYKLPLRFDVARLRREIAQFSAADWRPHPQGFKGNSALLLVSADGGDNDAMAGPMRETRYLRQCPYMRQVFASFRSVIGRSRLMRLEAEEEVAEHTDVHYYWFNRLRIHIPIVTDPSMRYSTWSRISPPHPIRKLGRASFVCCAISDSIGAVPGRCTRTRPPARRFTTVSGGVS